MSTNFEGFEICSVGEHESNDFLHELLIPGPFIVTGRFSHVEAIARTEEKGDLIAFGKLFVSYVCDQISS